MQKSKRKNQNDNAKCKMIFFAFIVFFSLFCFIPAGARAAEGMALSLTPPLIKNNINPGDIWRSAIKVINNNPNPIEIYLSTVDFKNGKDNGTVEFIKEPDGLNGDAKQYLLSKWIVIEPGPIEIPAFGSVEVPFIIDVPEKAGPGGHYAAILAGTKPPEGKISGTNIKISSLLASLILLKVNGDVKEIGQIREFSTNKSVFYEPKVNFTVRFENLGNVHIQPQGEIKIYNFFNKGKKTITLNHNSEFGNVLPGGIRKWNFSYEGEHGLLDMGRYRAELVLSYGGAAKQTVDRKIFFWIIYPRPLAIALGVILGLILIIIFIIRHYIKKSIIRAQTQLGLAPPKAKAKKPLNSKINKDALNLKTGEGGGKREGGGKYGWAYFKKIMIAIFILVILIFIALFYLNYREDSPARGYKSEQNIEPQPKNIDKPVQKPEKDAEEPVNISTSSPAAPKIKKTASTSGEVLNGENTVEKKELEEKKEKLVIKVLNGSGRPGAANDVAKKLENNSYSVAATANADNFGYNNTVIKYKKGLSEDVGILSAIFSEVPDVQEVPDQAEDIIIIVGKNFK